MQCKKALPIKHEEGDERLEVGRRSEALLVEEDEDLHHQRCADGVVHLQEEIASWHRFSVAMFSVTSESSRSHLGQVQVNVPCPRGSWPSSRPGDWRRWQTGGAWPEWPSPGSSRGQNWPGRRTWRRWHRWPRPRPRRWSGWREGEGRTNATSRFVITVNQFLLGCFIFFFLPLTLWSRRAAPWWGWGGGWWRWSRTRPGWHLWAGWRGGWRCWPRSWRKPWRASPCCCTIPALGDQLSTVRKEQWWTPKNWTDRSRET